jgi:hypothetical protein
VCYALVGAGVDVAALLDRVGLHVTTTSTQARSSVFTLVPVRPRRRCELHYSLRTDFSSRRSGRHSPPRVPRFHSRRAATPLSTLLLTPLDSAPTFVASFARNGPQFGTFALAYAAHKALSPVRFPPTVALTPIVAGWLGQEPNEEDDDEA